MSNLSKVMELIHIATIGKAVGLNGDMKFHIKCDFPEQFVKGATFFINKKETLTIESINHERALIKFIGFCTSESAKKLTNAKVFTTYEETKKNCHLEDGQYFWFDIVGCKVFENEKFLGTVIEVERIAVSDYLSIKTDDVLVADGFAKNFLIPYHETFIKNVDVEKKRIEVSGGLDILEAS